MGQERYNRQKRRRINSARKKKRNRIRILIILIEVLFISLLVLTAYEMENREKFHNIEVVEVSELLEQVV